MRCRVAVGHMSLDFGGEGRLDTLLGSHWRIGIDLKQSGRQAGRGHPGKDKKGPRRPALGGYSWHGNLCLSILNLEASHHPESAQASSFWVLRYDYGSPVPSLRTKQEK